MVSKGLNIKGTRQKKKKKKNGKNPTFALPPPPYDRKCGKFSKKKKN